MTTNFKIGDKVIAKETGEIGTITHNDIPDARFFLPADQRVSKIRVAFEERTVAMESADPAEAMVYGDLAAGEVKAPAYQQDFLAEEIEAIK